MTPKAEKNRGSFFSRTFRSLRQIFWTANYKNKREADNRIQHIFNATPLVCNLWTREFKNIITNDEAVKLFELSGKDEYIEKFFELSPEYQPNGRKSGDLAMEYIHKAFEEGYFRFEWMHQKLNGELMPCLITLVRVEYEGEYVVAGFTQDTRDHKQMMSKIEQRDHLLRTVNQTAVVLLSTENEENMKSVILTGMELLGVAVDVDRIHIWQNEVIDDELYFVHKFEWCSELGSNSVSIPLEERFSYKIVPEWERKFSVADCINGPMHKLPPKDQAFLLGLNIKTVLMIPMFLQDNFWGFFSLDDCRNERTFSDEEIDILRSGGLLIANTILRNDMMQNIKKSAAMLEEALKEAQEANTAKTRFLATMSHEIRTPMNVILGVTERHLENEDYPKEIKEALEKIYNSSDLLLHIINDILDLSKIEADKFELNPVKYETASLINDAVNLNVMKYGQKEIKFEVHADKDLPLNLFGDDLRIKQIINNLLSNAFKYTDSGEILLSFTSEGTTADSTTLVICVRDTGQGMTEAQINKLFDDYSRFNMEANRATVGTGLGMAITRNIIKLMDGNMHIESTPGVGSVFTVKIPQKVVGSDVLGKEVMENFKNFRFTEGARKGRAKITRVPMPYGKVLVVDDMQSNLDVAVLLLSPYQLQIDTAISGFEAIDLISKGNVYDIVFMDHMMPQMDGIETTKKMRECGYNHPIFALTANAITGQKEIFLANGFDGYISKPIDIRQLNETLNEFIRDKKMAGK